MRCLVGIDDTDSSRGHCTTYLAFRIACDLRAELQVVPYPRLVRLNPNIPFKTRGNAAVCLQIETSDPGRAWGLVAAKVSELSDVEGGANSGMVFVEGETAPRGFREIYEAALSGVVNPSRVRRFLTENGVRFATLGNGMGLVGAAASLGFTEADDHTFELISYRRPGSLGTRRQIDPSSVRDMDAVTFPHTFNNYDYQKKKVLVAPHGPDPVFAGLRGDRPAVVLKAYSLLHYSEEPEGHMVYMSNQHTDAHLRRRLDWKVYSSGWTEGTVETVETGPGGHVYVTLLAGGHRRMCAFYEPTADLRRVARRLLKGDRVRLSGGVRRATTVHPKVLNVERMEVLALAGNTPRRTLLRGIYISSPRANRHLTRPLARQGKDSGGVPAPSVEGWLSGPAIATKALVRSR